MANKKSKQGDKPSARIALRGASPSALPKSRHRNGRDELPIEQRVFPEGALLEVGQLERDLEQALGVLADLRERNPFGNAVKLLALELGKRLDKEALGYGDVERLIQHLTAESY